MMQAIETTGTVDAQGQLFLDRPLDLPRNRHVRIIVLIPDEIEVTEPDDPPTEVMLEGLRQGLQEVMHERPIPQEPSWESVDFE